MKQKFKNSIYTRFNNKITCWELTYFSEVCSLRFPLRANHIIWS